MAIKAYKLLATSEVADSPFRSLQDVERYLQGLNDKVLDLDGMLRQLQTQFARKSAATAAEYIFDVNDNSQPKKKGTKITLDKIDKIVVPKMDTLSKNFAIVDELSDQIEQLETLYNSVQVNFRGVRGAPDTLKSIEAMKISAEAKMKKALDFLNSIGSKHAPKAFTELVEQAIGFVSPSLTFKKHETSLYGYQTEAGELAFCVYVKLMGLTDDSGEVHKQMFLVFTVILKMAEDKEKVTPEYYVTVMNNFAVPGKFDLGTQVAHAAEATNAIGSLLDLENISTTIGQVPHGLSTKDFKRTKFEGMPVDKFKVEPNSITFVLFKKASKDDAEALAVQLYAKMKGMLAHIKKATLTQKIFEAEGVWNVRFTLTNVAKTGQVDVNDIEFLKEHFGLADDKLAKIVRIVNG